MENNNIKSALEILQRPSAVRTLLTDSSPTYVGNYPADSLSKDLSAELTVAIAEAVADENDQFAILYQTVKTKNSQVNRDLNTVIDIAGQTLEFLKENWGEIYFMLEVLNRKGKFEALKRKKAFKEFFETLFEEEIETEDEQTKE